VKTADSFDDEVGPHTPVVYDRPPGNVREMPSSGPRFPTVVAAPSVR
jgi:hypothetical protein